MRHRLPASLTVALLVALLGVSVSPATALFDGHLGPWLIVGAAAGSVLVTTVSGRWSAFLAAPVSLLALAGYCLACSALTRPPDLAQIQSGLSPQAHSGLPMTALDALRGGVARLLGSLLPVPTEPGTVLTPIVITWIAGLATAELALRHRRTLAALSPVAALYTLAQVFAGPHVVWHAWRPALVAAMGAATVVIASAAKPTTTPTDAAKPTTAAGAAGVGGSGMSRAVPRPRSALARRTAVRSACALAVLAAAAISLAPVAGAVADGAPTDVLRPVIPRDRLLDENPLVRLSGWALNPDAALFHTTVTGTTRPVRIRLAVLPTYDGVTWQVDGVYRPASEQLAPATGGTSIRQTITIDQLNGHLLPAAATPTRITGVRAAEDLNSGTLLLPQGLSPGLTYQVTSTPVTHGDDQPAGDDESTGDDQSAADDALTSADVPSGAAVSRYLDLPGTPPDEMLRLATQLGADDAGAFQRAGAIAAFLRTHYRLVADAPSGHAYPNLAFFLFADRAAGGQRGTSEQFAAAFAVLGRMLGLPTRVVVGFRAGPGASTVRGADALAWPEVLFDGPGWVPFDTLPVGDAPPRAVEQDFAPQVAPPQTPAPTAPPITASATPNAPVGAGDSGAHRSGGTPVVLLIVTALLVPVPAAVILFVGLRRARARRRLERASPAERVAAAWWELHTALRRAGHPAPVHLSVTAVAAHATACVEAARAGRRVPLRFAVPPLDELVEAVNAVTFAGGGLRANRPDDVSDERRAWRALAQSRAYATELRARTGWWHRLPARLRAATRASRSELTEMRKIKDWSGRVSFLRPK